MIITKGQGDQERLGVTLRLNRERSGFNQGRDCYYTDPCSSKNTQIPPQEKSRSVSV